MNVASWSTIGVDHELEWVEHGVYACVITGSYCIRASPTGGWPAVAAFDGPLPGQSRAMAGRFDDFVLEAIWRITREDDNSGIFLRSPELGDDLAPAIERGYEVQIDDRGLDPDAGRLGSPLLSHDCTRARWRA